MVRARLAFLVLLLVVFAGCSKTNQQNTSQQAPAGNEQTAAQPESQPPAPESGAQTSAPEPSGAAVATQKQARAGSARSAAGAHGTQPAATSPRSESASPASGSKASDSTGAPRTPEPRYATIADGASVQVRLQDALDTAVNKTGDTFRAILDKDIVVGGAVVAPRGSVVEGKLSNVARSGRVEGRAQMSLQLISLTIGKQSYPIRTNILAFEAESTKRNDAAKVGVGAGVGALIGAIAGGGKGAAIGAAVGAGAGGATVVATRGKELKFDAEHPLNFTLRDSIDIRLQ
jgi:hypothetical protein